MIPAGKPEIVLPCLASWNFKKNQKAKTKWNKQTNKKPENPPQTRKGNISRKQRICTAKLDEQSDSKPYPTSILLFCINLFCAFLTAAVVLIARTFRSWGLLQIYIYVEVMQSITGTTTPCQLPISLFLPGNSVCRTLSWYHNKIYQVTQSCLQMWAHMTLTTFQKLSLWFIYSLFITIKSFSDPYRFKRHVWRKYGNLDIELCNKLYL